MLQKIVGPLVQGNVVQKIVYPKKRVQQAGTILGQAHLKLKLELCFTLLKISCVKLIELVKLNLVW